MNKVRKVMKTIDATRGRFFSVRFVKRTTGETRRMVARTGVRKYVTGAGMSYDPRERGLVVVWAADRQQYRMIPAENVVSITFRGKEVKF